MTPVLSRQQRDGKPWETGQIGVESDDPQAEAHGERGEERVAPSLIPETVIKFLGRRIQERSARTTNERQADPIPWPNTALARGQNRQEPSARFRQQMRLPCRQPAVLNIHFNRDCAHKCLPFLQRPPHKALW